MSGLLLLLAAAPAFAAYRPAAASPICTAAGVQTEINPSFNGITTSSMTILNSGGFDGKIFHYICIGR